MQRNLNTPLPVTVLGMERWDVVWDEALAASAGRGRPWVLSSRINDLLKPSERYRIGRLFWPILSTIGLSDFHTIVLSLAMTIQVLVYLAILPCWEWLLIAAKCSGRGINFGLTYEHSQCWKTDPLLPVNSAKPFQTYILHLNTIPTGGTKMREWKMRAWKYRHGPAGEENVGV